MGLGGVYRLEADLKVIMWGTSCEGMGLFLLGESPLKAPCKYFDFAIGGGMKCMNWLKNGSGKGFIFHAIIPILYPL